MTSTDTTTQELYKNIGLDVINYDAKYNRSSGTVGQLVRSLQDMSSRVLCGEGADAYHADAYHAELHTQIVKQCNESVEFYEKLVASISPSEYSTFGYYLNGRLNNGKRRPIFSKNENKRYETSKLNETFRSIDDRLRNIKYACIRKKRDDQPTDLCNTLENVILFSNSYHAEIQKQLTTWYNFVKEIRVKHDFKTMINTVVDTQTESGGIDLPKILIRKKTYSENCDAPNRNAPNCKYS